MEEFKKRRLTIHVEREDLFPDREAVSSRISALVETWYDRVRIKSKVSSEIVLMGLENRARMVPTGTYDAVMEHSPKFKRDLIELKGVKGRSEIKFHEGNQVEDTEGCILVGETRRVFEIDGDATITLKESREAVSKLEMMAYKASEIIVIIC